MTEKPSATLPGTVKNIMKSPLPDKRERAQILIEGADHSHQEIRIENTLIDENSEEVHLKPGAKVQVTVRSRVAGNHFPWK
jgi:archaellum component FlaG (FlaF/FlaG flagellin family)